MTVEDARPAPYAAAKEPAPSLGYPLAVDAFDTSECASPEVFPETETPMELGVSSAFPKSD